MRGTELAIWADEFDLSAATSKIELKFAVGEENVTNLASEAEEFTPLLTKADLTQNGYFRGVLPNGFAAELQERLGGTGATIVTVLAEKSAPSCVAYVLENAPNFEMKFGGPAMGVVTLNGRWAAQAQVQRGRRVFDGALTATGAQAAVDFGAGVPEGGSVGSRAFLHVAAIMGTAVGAEIAVQSSPDGATWSDEGTFTFSAAGGYVLPLEGAIGRHVRLHCTDLGGATSLRCMAVVSLG